MSRMVLAATLLLAGCFFRFAPLAPPERVVPVFDAVPAAPGPGSGRVVLDVDGRRCRVRLATAHRTQSGARIVEQRYADASVLCVTPCQLELPLGVHRVSFCDARDFDVQVTPEVSVFRARVEGGGYHARGSSVQWQLATEQPPAPAR